MTTDTIDAPAEAAPSADPAQSPDIAAPENVPEAEPGAQQPAEGDPQQAEKPAAQDDPAAAARKVHEATQRRINRLVAERAQERAARQLLEQQLAHVTGAGQPAEDEGARRAQYATQPDPDAIRRQAVALVEAQHFNAQCNALVAKGRALAPDFDTKVASLTTITGPLLNDHGGPEPLLSAVLTAEAPHEVLAHLAAHPDVAADLVDLNPLQQARRIALIERDLKPSPRQPSAAPVPLKPITTPASADSEPDPSDVARWNDWYEKQRGGGRRRRR